MSATTNDPKALLHRLYQEMWNGADPAAARRLFANPEGVERFVREFLTAFPDLQHTVEDILVEGDRAAVRFSARGTHGGKWREFGPTGRPIHYTGATIARLAAGKITEHHTWWDTLEVIQQITG